MFAVSVYYLKPAAVSIGTIPLVRVENRGKNTKPGRLFIEKNLYYFLLSPRQLLD